MTVDGVDVDRLVDRFGPSARAWCARLDALVADRCRRWGLRPIELLPQGGTSVLIRCERETTGAVLKLTPEPALAEHEAAALTAWAGTPYAVDLLDADPRTGALLLEWLPDAVPLSRTDWSVGEVVPLVIGLSGASSTVKLEPQDSRLDFVFGLWQRRVARLPLAESAFTRGLALARRTAQTGPRALLHGDLHPGNVLRVPGRGLVAIDPRPCVGDPAADLVDWVLTGAGDEAAIRRRIATFAEQVQAVDADRLWSWCRAFAVLFVASILRRDADDPRLDLLRSIMV